MPTYAAPIASVAVVILASYGLWQNRRIRSLWLAATGLVLNTLVMWLNKGQMPISVTALEIAHLEGFLNFMQNSSDAVHTLIGPDTRLWFLGDVIPLPFARKVISLGDAFIILSLMLFFLETTKQSLHEGEAK